MQQTSHHPEMSAVIRKCCSRAAGGLVSSRSYAKFSTIPFNFIQYAPGTHGIPDATVNSNHNHHYIHYDLSFSSLSSSSSSSSFVINDHIIIQLMLIFASY
ncbi:hypothetical protein LOAG_13621 [Loa loa]|uniref:Uncharacterized protein n=1 Tax=Loa loa TaxID=7209 RepID=A0A1S0TJ43_LOALO|nr:hypothetical protein LOAG_13621 [Loa loa]EFO14894.1 hypothetical protein LOAG_13621 [Loa loa]